VFTATLVPVTWSGCPQGSGSGAPTEWAKIELSKAPSIWVSKFMVFQVLTVGDHIECLRPHWFKGHGPCAPAEVAKIELSKTPSIRVSKFMVFQVLTVRDHIECL